MLLVVRAVKLLQDQLPAALCVNRWSVSPSAGTTQSTTQLNIYIHIFNEEQSETLRAATLTTGTVAAECLQSFK